jgi:NADH-quinone oxidoreductase subunit G
VVASDVMDEIAATVRGYSGASYISLGLTRSASWGRQSNEAIYYDGTSYENSEGVGVQVPSDADDARASFSFPLPTPAPREPLPQGGLALLVPARAYDGGDWSRGSKLTPRQVPPHAILSRADAERLGVAMGEVVRIESARGAIELPATVDAGLAAGFVLVPMVRGAGVGALVTGGATAVSVTKVEG